MTGTPLIEVENLRIDLDDGPRRALDALGIGLDLRDELCALLLAQRLYQITDFRLHNRFRGNRMVGGRRRRCRSRRWWRRARATATRPA